MIANNLQPSTPIHPGEIIKDEMEFRGITQRQLAKRRVSTEYALLFEAALGIDAELWIHLQTQYDLQMAKSNTSFVERLNKIRKIAAVL